MLSANEKGATGCVKLETCKQEVTVQNNDDEIEVQLTVLAVLRDMKRLPKTTIYRLSCKLAQRTLHGTRFATKLRFNKRIMVNPSASHQGHFLSRQMVVSRKWIYTALIQ